MSKIICIMLAGGKGKRMGGKVSKQYLLLEDKPVLYYSLKAFEPYVAPFDGIIMWTWCEKNIHWVPKKFEAFKKLTEGKRRMIGCYLWNFGEKKPATAEAVKWQLDWYRERLLAGEIEGVVLHTNTMADLDYEAYDAATAWMEEHGDEEI